MPELPEVETSRRGITPHLQNQQIVKVIIRQHQLRWPIPNSLKRELEQTTVRQISRRGKYILLYTETGCLLIHLGMSGNLRILPHDAPALKHDHVDIVLESGQCLRFNDPRRFGSILWTKKDPFLHKLLVDLGPEPLTADFNGDYLFLRSRQKKITIKQFIMDSKIVVGVGNIYACEALFRAKILPTKSAGEIDTAAYKKLVTAIKFILQCSIAIGGTTLRDFVGSNGNPGYFKQKLNVYGRAGLPCKKCNHILLEIRLSNRSTVYCATCQK